MGCRKSFFENVLLNDNFIFTITYRTFVARNIYINGKKAVISAILHDKHSTNSSTFDARFSGVIADVEAPGGESGKH